MVNYYNLVEGNLHTGDIAKSSDINHIQSNIQDMARALLLDLHDGESYILGSGDEHRNDFVLTGASKDSGRYIDSKNVFTVSDDKCLNFNRNDIKQPLLKTKTSLYSVVTKVKNTSNRDIPVDFELQDENGTVLRKNNITIPKNCKDKKIEIVFDLDFYPTAHNLSFKDIKDRDGKDIAGKTKEGSFDEGYEFDHTTDDLPEHFTAGISKLYFVIKRTNLNAIDLADNGDEDIIFDPDESLGVYYQEGSDFPDKNIFTEVNSGVSNNYTEASPQCNIYYEDIYANSITYLCKGGQAIIDGEKVLCLDTHISIDTGSSYGNALSQIYMDNFGHLRAATKQISFAEKPDEFIDDIEDALPMSYLPIALILTYSNAKYGLSQEPLVIQLGYNQLPRSHHERLRRLEKKMDWTTDVALPSRIKYTITGRDWIDDNDGSLINLPQTDSTSQNVEQLNNNNIFVTTDTKGNLVVQLTNAKTHTIPITLKEKIKDSDGKDIQLEETDILNASAFSELTNIVHDSTNGTLVLDTVKTETKNNGIATTAKEAKLTEFNPWDDSAANRPTSTKIEKHEREYVVISGKNGQNDFSSKYPAMTFYTKTNYKMKKLQIPIHKFKNCSAIKFFIWKRQDTNNKKNTVWLKKLIHTSKEFSLKKAKEKGNYQYMDEGFTIDFGTNGLSLPKGQYVIIALPIPKSGKGSVFVETYKPQNSKDFCIRYKGAANASHFVLDERYQEIWYNSASATVVEENYATKGTAVSKTLTWTETGLERIKTIKPIVGEHITLGNKKCSWKIYANTGGNWQELTVNKDNEMNDGGATTFKWKIEFTGDGKDTPKLAYNSKDGYAIQFILTREKSGTQADNADIGKNMCITSKPFNGDDILREYIGDPNFGLTHSRFNGFEFGRVWADPNINEKLLIDIQASDRNFEYTNNNTTYTTPLWSLHYCDLTLRDFSKTNVDYSDYTEELEYDENNMRFKIDTNHSYNDDDIEISSLQGFKKVSNDIDDTTNDIITFVNQSNVEKNQVFLKKTFENPIDLTKYTGLKLVFDVIGNKGAKSSLEGIGLYISSDEEKVVPSDIENLPNLEDVLEDTEIIPNIIDPDESSASYYDGKIIRITHHIDTDSDGNKAYKDGFYQYVQDYDIAKNKYVYKLQQLHDVRSYNIYKIKKIKYDGTEGEQIEVRIEIDQDSNNLKYVKEIGLISLNDEGNYLISKNTENTTITYNTFNTNKIDFVLKDNENNVVIPNVTVSYNFDNANVDSTTTTDTNGVIGLNTQNLTTGSVTISFAGNDTYSACSSTFDYDFTNDEPLITPNNSTSSVGDYVGLKLVTVKAINEDSFAIFNPETESSFIQVDSLHSEHVTVYPHGSLSLTNTTYDTNWTSSSGYKEIKDTTPITAQINIKHKEFNTSSEALLCYINNPYEDNGGLSKYKHIGVQIASDVYLPKDSIKINLCSEKNGIGKIASINLPTLNTIYYPNTAQEVINLSQIFKKIDSDEKIGSISIETTKYFKDFVSKSVKSTKPAINLFLGKIVLYKAETIPILHNQMRFKFYSTTDGEIDHEDASIANKSISIRKIGAVLDYN